nr:retrotransposon protein, putative, Ty1-copia subclass [Tanacetum cinerariifolium]
MDGNVHTYKALLVAKGCTQTFRIDYQETFSPVADIRAIRILIAIAAYCDYEIWQMDVKTAFLNGRLDEDIYMEQSEGLKEVKDYLGKCFSVKDLGEAAYILGIKIYKDRSLWLIRLNQSAYIDKILNKFNMQTLRKTSYVFVVNGGAVDWKSKKQTTIAMHATQSEYMVALEVAMEAVWIRKFVGDLGVMPSINKPINMYCDNSAAIILANEPGVMKGARYFLRRYHYVREQVESGEIKL